MTATVLAMSASLADHMQRGYVATCWWCHWVAPARDSETAASQDAAIHNMICDHRPHTHTYMKGKQL